MIANVILRQAGRNVLAGGIRNPGQFANKQCLWTAASLPFKSKSKEANFSTSPVAYGSDKLWGIERAVSALQIPALIVPFLLTNPATDAMFCTLAVLHSHWGVEAIVVDYIRPSLFNGSTTIPNIAQGLIWAISVFTLGGLYYFNYTDVGIINAIKMLWKL